MNQVETHPKSNPAGADQPNSEAARGDGGLAGADGTRFRRGLASLRSERGLSQAALAVRSGIARPYINALEAGRPEPTLRTLAALAQALDYSLAEVTWRVAGQPYADPGASLAQRVRMRRLALGYPRQSDFADAAGLPRATVNQVEHGRIATPRLGLLCRLAQALRCCPSELVAGLDQQAPTAKAGGRASLA